MKRVGGRGFEHCFLTLVLAEPPTFSRPEENDRYPREDRDPV